MSEEQSVPTSYVIMRKKDYLNLRKLGRRFPIVGDMLVKLRWFDCTDQEGEVWNGLLPDEWHRVDNLVRQYPKILKAAQDLQIDVMMGDEKQHG